MVGSRFGGRPLALPSHLTAATDGDASDQDGAQSPGGFSDTFSPHPALGMAHKPHMRGSGGAGVGHHRRLSVTDASNAEFPFTAPTTVCGTRWTAVGAAAYSPLCCGALMLAAVTPAVANCGQTHRLRAALSPERKLCGNKTVDPFVMVVCVR